MPAKLNYRKFLDTGLLDEIISVFDEKSLAESLLFRIDFPASARPHFTTPMAFWEQVIRELDRGVIEDGFEKLLAQAARMYPQRKTFVYREEVAVAPEEPQKTGGQHDVYLVFHPEEIKVMQAVNRRFAKKGISVWLDSNLPGHTLSEQLDILKQASYVCVFIGKNGLPETQRYQLEAALNLMLAKQLKIIPVLLAGVDRSSLPVPLAHFEAIAFEDTYDVYAMDKLVDHIHNHLKQ